MAVSPQGRSRLQRLLGHPRLPLFLAIIAVLLCIPSLWLGFQWDDHYIRLVLMRPAPIPEWERSPLELFSFYPGDGEFTLTAMDRGTAPWWTKLELHLAFFRPLTGITHWIDFRLWPGHPWVMHLHSLLWFGAAIAVAGLMYRRLLLPPWVAGLAALFFAIDDAHGMPAVWIANRNACIGALFGFVALIAHDRWRRHGWRPGRVAAPLALLLGLLAGEIALATVAYLVAYALFLDRDRWLGRLGSLVPSGLVCIGWWFGYRWLGYGAGGSAMYVDPGASPLEFARAAVERAPLLFFGQWALPSQYYLLLSQRATEVMWLVAVGLVAAIGFLLWPLIRRDRMARFFAFGMIFSLLPACATLPGDRLLFLAGFGGMGLLAQFVAGVRGRAEWLPRFPVWRVLAHGAVWVLLVIHLVFAPVLLLRASAHVKALGDVIERAADSLPADPAVVDQQLLIVNTPSTFISAYGVLIQFLDGRPTAPRIMTLGSSIHPIGVSRPAENLLVVRPEGGFLAPRGSPVPGQEAEQPPFDYRYMFPVFDPLYRDATPMQEGERIELTGLTVEIMTVTEDGRPHEVAFRFDRSLDDPSLRWLEWDDGVYVPFVLPPVGESVTLPAVTVPYF
jgi:hypothetical protein